MTHTLIGVSRNSATEIARYLTELAGQVQIVTSSKPGQFTVYNTITTERMFSGSEDDVQEFLEAN